MFEIAKVLLEVAGRTTAVCLNISRMSAVRKLSSRLILGLSRCVVVGIANHDGRYIEIIARGRRRCLPFQASRVPRIGAGQLAVAQ